MFAIVVLVIVVVAVVNRTRPTELPFVRQTIPAQLPAGATTRTRDELAILKTPSAGHTGSFEEIGCGDNLWQHVYRPERLTVFADCLTVTGIIVDATASLTHSRKDGVRKEKDGDTHGWLKVDRAFENLLSEGNESNEEGNLVFEIVCYWSPTQLDAQPACSTDYRSGITLPPIGKHVAMTGTYVQDHNHARWMEIHPVSHIEVTQ
jgi:hypothetical protein